MFRSVLILSTVLALTGCAAEIDQPAQAESAVTAHGRVGSHGMVLVGSPDAAYLSHVPMFNTPHDVQLLLSVSLEGGSAKLPASFSDRLFTFLPEVLSLDDLRLGALRKIRGTVFLGSFEHGGTPIAKNVTVNVTSIIHQNVLDAHSTDAPGWFVFGDDKATFAAHRITTSPGFDQIVRVTTEKKGFVETSGADVPMTTDPIDGITPETSLSCLVGPDFFDPCE
jgi:hypothetical protein